MKKMKIKEEFSFDDIKGYLDENITLVIANDSNEERKKYLFSHYSHKKRVISISFYKDSFVVSDTTEIFPLSKKADYNNLGKVLLSFPNICIENILIDITSLQHVTIACLLRTLILELKPARLFLSYVKPERYIREKFGVYEFSKDFFAPSAIPGFASRSKEDEILVPFLGFEGMRLKNIIGDEHYSDINPIVGFPSDNPMWQFETLKNCKDSIEEQGALLKIRKCKADSIYDAYEVLDDVASDFDKPLVMAPLGTRPHFVATVLYAINHKGKSRIIYDNAAEKNNNTQGIGNIKIYHISRFIGEVH